MRGDTAAYAPKARQKQLALGFTRYVHYIQDECMIIYPVMVESQASLHTLLWEEEFNMNNKDEDDVQRTSFGMQLEMEEE